MNQQLEEEIAKRKEAEKKLAQSEESARKALAELSAQKSALDQHAIVAITDIGGTITYVNEKFCAISGYSKEELLGNNHRMLNSGIHPAEFFQDMYRAITAGNVWENEICNRAKEGHLYWVKTTIVPFSDASGKPYQYIAIRSDITEIKRAEQQISMERQFALDTVEALSIPTFIIDAEHRVLMWNYACEELTGVSAAEVVGTKDAWRGFYATQRPCLADIVLDKNDNKASAYYAHVDPARFSRGGLHAEGWFPILNGKRRFLIFEAAPIFDSQGTLVAVIESLEDITDRKLIEEELKQFKNTLDKTLDCVFMFDGESLSFTYVNEGAMRQVGYTYDELLTMHPYDIKPEFNEREFRSMIAPLIAGDIPSVNFETVHQSKNGQRIPVEISLQYIADKPAHFVAIVRDVTERKKIDRMKTEFISTVSHELRTPLTSIMGSLGLVMGGVGGELPAKSKTLIDMAHKNSQRLVALINDILDIEKIESGSMAFDMKPTALMPLLAQSLEATKGYFEHHGNHCALVASLDAGVMVNVDDGRLLQVMANLLSNAAKFAPKDSQVEVGAELRGDLVRVWVRDHGPGVPEEFRTRMFQKFSQADSSDTRQKGGSGLGLSIVKTMLEHMQGSIGVDSVEGEGATFYFELPVWGAAMEHHQTQDALQPAGEEGNSRILHVEDEVDIRQIVRSLVDDKAHVVPAPTLAEARHQLEQGKFDLIVLDLGMPDGDGADFVTYLREQHPAIPVLIFSVEEPSEAVARQVSAVLVKTRSSNDLLLETMQRLCKKNLD